MDQKKTRALCTMNPIKQTRESQPRDCQERPGGSRGTNTIEGKKTLIMESDGEDRTSGSEDEESFSNIALPLTIITKKFSRTYRKSYERRNTEDRGDMYQRSGQMY